MAELNELERQIDSAEKFKEIISKPENESSYPNIFAAAKEQGVIQASSSPESDPILKHIQNRYGNAYETVEDFFRTVDDLQERGSVNPFENVPDVLLQAVQAAKSNQDWMKMITPDKLIDYTKNYSDTELLDIYLPGVYNQEDFADDTKKPLIGRSIAQAQQLHKTAKATEENRKLLIRNRNEENNKYFTDSIEKAIAKAKKTNPHLNADQLQLLRKELQTGKWQRDLYWDAKGGVSEDAALNLVPLRFGDDFRSWMRKDVVSDNNGKLQEQIRQVEETPIRTFNRQPDSGKVVPKQTPDVFKQTASPYAVKSPTTNK